MKTATYTVHRTAPCLAAMVSRVGALTGRTRRGQRLRGTGLASASSVHRKVIMSTSAHNRIARSFSFMARLLCIALVVPLLVVVAPVRASAAVTSPLDLKIELLSGNGFSPGDVVTLRFTGTNATSGPLAIEANASLWLEVGHYYSGVPLGSMSDPCVPNGWGDLGNYSMDLYTYQLPTSLAAGESVSCTLTYTATAADVANGGMFTTLKYVTGGGMPQDTGWWFYTVPAHGVADLPEVTGTASVGQQLGVAPSYWGMWDASFTYQWLRDDVPIAGAMNSTYTLTADDLGAHISVRIVASSGDSWITVTSLATAAVGSPVVTPTTAFVKAAYQDFLGRAPTVTELSAAVSSIDSGAVPKPAFLRALANSSEWLSVIVTNMYRDTLGREPDQAGLTSWVEWIRSGRFTVAQVAGLFYSSQEFYQGLGGNTPSSWVTQLYQKLLLRKPDAAGLDGWVGYTNNPDYGRTFVAANFYQSLESRMTRVKNLYQILLGRGPDPTGWPFWSDVIARTGDVELAVSLAGSDEYSLRAQTRF